MFKRSFLTACLFLILQINSNEKNLLADSLDYLNQQEVPVYRIELIIIKNLLIDEDDKQEKWPLLEEFIFSTELIELSSEPTLLVKEGFLNAKNQDTKLTFKFNIDNGEEQQPIQPNTYSNRNSLFFEKITLNSSIAPFLEKLKLSAGYRIIFESTWVQPVFPNNKAITLYIENIDKKNKVYGELKVYKDRYLHSNIKLRFAEEVNVNKVNKNPILIDFNKEIQASSPKIPVKKENDEYWKKTIFSDIKLKLQNLMKDPIIQKKHLVKKEPFQKKRYFSDLYELNETRKMKADEFHYIDHPYFGVLIRIVPIK